MINTLTAPPARVPPSTELRPTPLPACSICLRIFIAGEWVESEELIKTFRTYELSTVPRFLDGICVVCVGARRERRQQAAEA